MECWNGGKKEKEFLSNGPVK